LERKSKRGKKNRKGTYFGGMKMNVKEMREKKEETSGRTRRVSLPALRKNTGAWIYLKQEKGEGERKQRVHETRRHATIAMMTSS
jgi:hypothetical protein